MARVKGGPASHARHRNVQKAAKGYFGRRKNCFRTAKQAVEKAGQYAYIGRKQKKRNFRALWIDRIVEGRNHVHPAGRDILFNLLTRFFYCWFCHESLFLTS